jgi:shikimate dehydrogenase
VGNQIKLGVIGDPIDHSMSPLIHSQFGEATGLEIDFRSFHVVERDLDKFIESFFADGGYGLNVTLPHKLNCIRSADILSSEVELLGAANTLSKNSNNQIIASSTDGIGLIRDCSDKNIEISNKRILILGAGGASQSIIPAIARMNPTKLMIDNRSPDKIEHLLKKYSSLGLQTLQHNNEPIDLLINATSAALSGSFNWNIQNQLNEETIFYDLSYGKASANFFSWASQFSKNRFDGTGMLIAQAAFSFQLWFDTFPDTSNIKLSNADD